MHNVTPSRIHPIQNDISTMELEHGIKQLGERMMTRCPDNDCMIFRNLFEDYQRSLEQYNSIASHMTYTLRLGMQTILRERRQNLALMYNKNPAVLEYRSIRPANS